MTEGLETPKMLVLSTAHIRPETDRAFDDFTDSDIDPVPGIFYPKIAGGRDGESYGWLIPIGPEIEWSHMVSDDLVAIRKLAEREGCTWIMLDRDGDTTLELPEYAW